MTNVAQKLIESFETLSETEQHEVLAQLLHIVPSHTEELHATSLIVSSNNARQAPTPRSLLKHAAKEALALLPRTARYSGCAASMYSTLISPSLSPGTSETPQAYSRTRHAISPLGSPIHSVGRPAAAT